MYSYGKPLVGPGLTIGSKGDPGTATQALADWSMQFGLTGSGAATKPTSKEKGKKPAMKEAPKKEAPKMQPQKNSMGASPNMKLGGAINHVHVLLKHDIVSVSLLFQQHSQSLFVDSATGLMLVPMNSQGKLKARALKQGVPKNDVTAAKSKEEVVALLYEYR